MRSPRIRPDAGAVRQADDGPPRDAHAGLRGRLTDLRGRLTDLRGRLSGVGGRLSGVGGRLTDLRGRLSGVGDGAGTWLLLRCLRRFVAINGRDRAFVLAGQAFTTVIPLLIIIGAATRQNGASLVADRLNRRFRLSGPPAEALRSLFERPPGATGAVTVVGLLILLFSLGSLTRSLQRTFEEAWGLPPAGLRGVAHGLTGFGLLLASVLVLSVLAGLVRPLPAGALVGLVARTVVDVGIWLVLQRLLLSGRVGWRRLLPGAVVAGLGQTAMTVYSGISMPRVIAHNADRYGVIGITFAMVSWLVVIGLALVALAVVSAEAGGAAPARLPAAAGGAGPVDTTT